MASPLLDRAAVTGPSNTVLRDGTLTVELEMTLLGRKKNAPCVPFVPSNPSAENIKQLFLDERTADVMFAVQKEDGGETTNFCAHRLVLQASARNLAELADDMNPILITRVEPNVFKLLLYYVYGGSISDEDWTHHVKELIDAADLYGVVNLKLEAEARYAKCTRVTIDNVVGILVFADSKQCAHLKEVALDFVVKNKNNVLKTLQNVPESSTMFTDLLAAMARWEKKANGSCDRESMDTMRVGTLRRMLHEKGLEVDGSRDALIARLKENSREAREKRKRSSSQGEVVDAE